NICRDVGRVFNPPLTTLTSRRVENPPHISPRLPYSRSLNSRGGNAFPTKAAFPVRIPPMRARFLSAIVPALLPALCAVPAAAERPNILFLLADDMRPDAIAALGNPRISTPNLDALV